MVLHLCTHWQQEVNPVKFKKTTHEVGRGYCRGVVGNGLFDQNTDIYEILKQ